METVENIFCVGRNYSAHVAELNNQLPTEPVWFMKPSHSLVFCDEQEKVILPSNQGSVHYELELVIQLGADYLPDLPLEKVIGQVALGIDFTLKDIQTELKNQGLPWLRAKGFRNSAVITASLPFSSIQDWEQLVFALEVNQQVVQLGKPAEMIYSVETLLKSCWDQFDLKKGDLIFTGTPVGVGQANSGDQFELFLNAGRLGVFELELK